MPAAFDFSVNSLALSEAGVYSEAAAQASEVRKHSSPFWQVRKTLMSVLIETHGARGQVCKMCGI